MPVESQPSRHWTDGVLTGKADLPVDYTSAGPAPVPSWADDLADVGGGGLEPATAFTTETMPDPVSGEGDMTVLVFPQWTTYLAIKIEGDDHPRFLMTSPSDGWYFGDGTENPYPGPLSISVGAVADVPRLFVNPVTQFNDDVRLGTGKGVVLKSPDGTDYRVKVGNDGVVSSEVVA